MTSDLKPYPAYRDSGVPWLGDVPEHWDTGASKVAIPEDESTHTGFRRSCHVLP